jgi:transcriptional regulator with XRE-family HTH domain
MNNNYIGENIKIYRERLNLTQQQLADKIGKTWEMISRYERGASSPLNQLHLLAQALKVSPADLLRDITEASDISQSFNRILFNLIPQNFNFKKSNTYLYYNAPDWISGVDPEAFAIDMSLVGNSKGLLYISPNSEVNLNDLVVVKEDNSLKLVNLNSFKDIDIIGKVLAQEVRFF